MEIITTYKYYHGGGTKPNRKIEFCRDDKNPRSVEAIVSARVPRGWQKISSVPGKKINVEMMSTTEKMQVLMAKRERLSYVEKKDKTLDECTINKQDSILGCLSLDGTWRVEILSTIGGDPTYEAIENLNLFNPS